MHQSLLTAALAVPLVAAIATTPPFSAAPRAAGVTHMLGPNAPITAGSENIVPTRSGNTVSYPSTWACGNTTSDAVTFSNPDGLGRFRTASRDNGYLHQTATITGFTSGGFPQQITITETMGGTTVSTTTVTLADLNSDGVIDAVTFSGQYNATINFVYSGNNISIPWSMANTIGINTTYSCGSALPQVWIPLADTNGDGRGDSIVLDLDGNGTPDADFFRSPPMAVSGVPTMGPVGRLVLILLLGGIGSWFLSRRQTTATAPFA